MTEPSTHEVEALVNEIRPLLAGKGPAVQGAVLADLLAMFIAGHRDAELRDEILQLHIEAVRHLIPFADLMFKGREQ
jgi:hypothetical protein